MEKKVKLYVAFGHELTRSLNCGKEITGNERGFVRNIEFATPEECAGYMIGIRDAVGWDDYMVITEKEYKKIKKTLK